MTGFQRARRMVGDQPGARRLVKRLRARNQRRKARLALRNFHDNPDHPATYLRKRLPTGERDIY